MEGKVIVVTGAASGIGLETAKLLASKGCKVSLADVQEEPLQAVINEIKQAGGTAIGQVVDIRKRDQVDAWINETVKSFGKLDGCANIAGIIGKNIGLKSIWEIEDEDWDFVMDVNIKGLMNCLR
jgi:NADP-dependent 3-hydroxy acid dehydrogenase YdfG